MFVPKNNFIISSKYVQNDKSVKKVGLLKALFNAKYIYFILHFIINCDVIQSYFFKATNGYRIFWLMQNFMI